jgi:hypothetical protein
MPPAESRATLFHARRVASRLMLLQFGWERPERGFSRAETRAKT